jgi:hypothetical protein
MLEARFRPIDKWPGIPTPSYHRKRSTFSAGYQKTLNELEGELNKLRAKNIVIQIALDLSDIRNDGWPRSSARPKSPGVIVSCETTKGPLSFPCDRFTVWEDNLRAIAKSLEALRTVDRYGVTRNNEQYKGWTQLPADPNGSMLINEAAEFLSSHSGFEVSAITAEEGLFLAAYREAARKLHPDAGGSHDAFVRLQKAKVVLSKRFAA